MLTPSVHDPQLLAALNVDPSGCEPLGSLAGDLVHVCAHSVGVSIL